MKIAAVIGGLFLMGLVYYGVRQLLGWAEKANKAMKQVAKVEGDGNTVKQTVAEEPKPKKKGK